MDLSQFSTDDLKAMQTGDLSKVSSVGLKALQTMQTRAKIDADPISQGAQNFNAGDSFGSNVVTGIGRGMSSVGRGLGQLVGLTSQDDVDEAKKTDAALMKTGGGKVGNVLGNAAVAAPIALIPGANTALGATALGAGFGGLTTEGGLKDRAIGAVEGGIGGGVGVGIGKGIGMAAERLTANRLAAQTANAGKDAAADAAKTSGYVLPPTEVSPTVVNSLLEGLSGKIKTSQAASARNQPVTNSLAQKELGLPDAPITKDALNGIRAAAGKAYDAVASAGTVKMPPSYDAALDAIVNPFLSAAKGFPGAKPNPIIAEIESLRTPIADAGSIVSKIKELRATADAAYAAGNKDMGKALKGGADALEGAIDSHLVATGAPADVLKNFREARQLIAKTYSVEKATNLATGDVSANALAKQLEKGKPLSGGLKTIAEISQAFPKATQSLKQNYNPVSPLDYAAGAFGLGTGNPLAGLAMAARPGVRSAILSKPYQALLKADYSPSTILNMLSRNPALPIAGMALPANQ